ncbi:MAG: clan AA aspartic protease [Nitrospinae bacterium]|nr:clan AA aspartic protease [Nitrospinota bacterium]
MNHLRLAAALLAAAMTAAPAGVYRFVDDQGQAHYVDSPGLVPLKYRNQVEEKVYKKPDASTVAPQLETEESGLSSTAPEAARGALKRFEIPYQPYEGGARRIIIPVTFNNSVTAPMLLDTGAPGIIISDELAEKLGLFDRDVGMLLSRAGGIGGVVPAKLTIVDTVEVGGARAEFLPTTITDSISNAFEGLVGMDFMANYDISIDTRRHVLLLQQQPPSSDRPGGHDEAWWRINYHKFSQLRNGWKNYLEKLKKNDTKDSSHQKLIDAAEQQLPEAEKLFRKLDSYASRHSAPMNWRRY